jgi:hypothetical protein
MHWDVKNFRGDTAEHYRQATKEEIAEAQSWHGAPHVYFGCKCGCGFWTAKNLTLTSEGGYNCTRNIFYYGDEKECSCSYKDLVYIVKDN